jgi:pyrimidine operon attenuation protein / uracil phosphoribosyltransferase
VPVIPLPDPEALLAQLARSIRPHVRDTTALVGVHTGGVWLAQRLHRELGIQSPLGSLDVTFYRDDYGKIGLHPSARPSDIPFEVAGREIILVDDVLYTGRTIRAAMNELFDYGRPAHIRLAALVDRQQRELPIQADFVGATFPVPSDEMLVLEQDAHGHLALRLQPKVLR